MKAHVLDFARAAVWFVVAFLLGYVAELTVLMVAAEVYAR